MGCLFNKWCNRIRFILFVWMHPTSYWKNEDASIHVTIEHYCILSDMVHMKVIENGFVTYWSDMKRDDFIDWRDEWLSGAGCAARCKRVN